MPPSAVIVLSTSQAGADGPATPATADDPTLARLTALSGVDVARGVRALGRRQDRYLELVRWQFERNAACLDAIRQHLAAGDARAAESIVHTMKGATGSLGLTAMYDAASELEEWLRESMPDIDVVAMPDRLAALERAQRELASVLDGTHVAK